MNRIYRYAIAAVILIGGFVLRERSLNLEPYPAVVFPVGSYKKHVQDSVINYNGKDIGGMSNGEFKKIKEDVFLNHEVFKRFRRARDHKWGLMGKDKPIKESLGFKQKMKRLLLKPTWSKEEKETAKQWIADKLKKSNLGPDKLYLRNSNVNYVIKTEVRDTLSVNLSSIDL